MAARRILPLEVFSTVLGCASMMSSAGRTDQRDGELVDLSAQRLAPGRVGLTRFREHDDLLGAGARILAAEHGDAALADVLEVADRFLEIEWLERGRLYSAGPRE